MTIENFLERNYINPIIKKITDRHMVTEKKECKCSGCKDPFERAVLIPVKYNTGKQILLCVKCYKKLKRRV